MVQPRCAVVTVVTFVAVAAGAGTVLLAARARALPRYPVGFIVLFVLSGVGNGSTYG